MPRFVPVLRAATAVPAVALGLLASLALLPLGAATPALDRGASPPPDPSAAGASQERVFELRTYTAHEGRLDDVVARFRDHTLVLLEKHGMEHVGYWVPQDDPLGQNTLIYLLAHESREAAQRSWSDFLADPAWHAARDASEANGPILQGVVRVFMDPTDFSPMR